ncbi:winged helix DNA-binding protein [Kaustia mangrovi]|uniref:Winged helix DNA-binding protein n=1 Tax=Kaustia mangrovi TaxID=2593653 RepID=A0A7S8HAJ4_9HYPH|nr:MarR family transcriptional regulator [Kaustia mangrovi]QPC41506.1 winged helix DNA-binding protein [Kaustia mangrovi]
MEEHLVKEGKRTAVSRAERGNGASAPLATSDHERDTEAATHLELARVLERIYRRYTDLLRGDLNRLGVDDASPSQVMMLFTIGHDELSIRELLDRGHYLGSNASYNLKQLGDAGYIERETSPRDRRSARIRLAPKGHELCDAIRGIHDGYHRLVVRDEMEYGEMETAFRMLRRLEEVWTTTLRYGDAAWADATPPTSRNGRK